MSKVAFFAAVMVVVSAGPGLALDGGDATKGEQIFKQCMTCHRIGPDAKNLVGPVLTGAIGRRPGPMPPSTIPISTSMPATPGWCGRRI